jgi:hypothetical protein
MEQLLAVLKSDAKDDGRGQPAVSPEKSPELSGKSGALRKVTFIRDGRRQLAQDINVLTCAKGDIYVVRSSFTDGQI